MAGERQYVQAPIETDPTALAEDAIAEFQDRIPDWEYNRAAPESILIDTNAAMAAEARDVASDVPAAIFAYFGAKLAGLPPQEASPATATSTWTAQDDAGYTVEEGMAVGLRAAGDELVEFRVVASVTIPPGSTTTAPGEVELVATVPGEGGNGFEEGTEAEVIDATLVDWTVVLASDSALGEEAESEEDYLNRLAAELALQSPRPIVPSDFAVLYERIDEVDRALALDLYKPGTNERQTISHNGSGGTGTLTFSGQTTAAITSNADADLIRTRLVALSNIGADDVKVSGGPWPAPVTVEFTGALGEADQPQITASAVSLTPGGSAFAIATTQAGAAPETARERSVTLIGVDADGEPVSELAKEAGDALLQAMREVNFEVWVADPTYTTIDCTFTATAWPGFDAAEVEAAAVAAVEAYLSPRDFGIPPYGEQRVWELDDKIRTSEISEALNRVDGLRHVDSVQIAKSGASLGTADVDMPGTAPLPRAGTVNGTVSA